MPTDPKKAGAFKRREQSTVYIVKGPKGQEFEFEDPSKAQEFIDNYRKRKLPVDSLKEAGVDASDRQFIRYQDGRSHIGGVGYAPGSALRTADSTAIAMKQAELTAKKRDLQKPIDNLAKFHQLQNEASSLGMIVASGKATQDQIDRFEATTEALRTVRGSDRQDEDLSRLNEAIDIGKNLSSTTKNPLTGLDEPVFGENDPTRKNAQERIINNNNVISSKKWARILYDRGLGNRSAVLRAHGKNQQIFQELTNDAKSGRIPVDMNSPDPRRRQAAKEQLRRMIDERMRKETGISYDEYKQMLNDFPNQ